MSLFTRAFWNHAVERSLKTAAQLALVVLGGDAISLLAVDWLAVASLAGGGAVVSLLTSVASSRIGDDTPSMVR